MTSATVLASYARLKTLSDGTLQLTLNVEPKDAPTAFAMCDKPGASIVLARITDQAAQAADWTATAPQAEAQEGVAGARSGPDCREPRATSSDTKKPLSLPQKVAVISQSPSFIDWLREFSEVGDRHWDTARRQCSATYGLDSYDATTVAKHVIYIHCGVGSRSDISEGSRAGALWNNLEADYHD